MDEKRVYLGFCPDKNCNEKLCFTNDLSSIECRSCGRYFQTNELKDVQCLNEKFNPKLLSEVYDLLKLTLDAKKSIHIDSTPDDHEPLPKMPEHLGISQYQCKTLSYLLTNYGMDASTGQAKLLTQLGKEPIIDCGILSERGFCIDFYDLSKISYGVDRCGSQQYLCSVLELLQRLNEDEQRIVPLHADPDGHCLVHAISRALVGHQLFWHPLRINLKLHLQRNLVAYRQLFGDFIPIDDWDAIIAEADPTFKPPEGETFGLRNIHIFGLANVLRRPIILLDCLTGLEQRAADYSGIFLPTLCGVVASSNKAGVRHKPLVIAWSTPARNHFVPLVAIRGRPAPRLPRWMLSRAWGVPDRLIDDYVEFDADGCCAVGGERPLPDSYIVRLVTAMEQLFADEHGVSAHLVAEMHHCLASVIPSTSSFALLARQTREAIDTARLFRCVNCQFLSVADVAAVDPALLARGGRLYGTACTASATGQLMEAKNYQFPRIDGLRCRYDPISDRLWPVYRSLDKPCISCSRNFLYRCSTRHHRLISPPNGAPHYVDFDATSTPAAPVTSRRRRCRCGFKHYYNGRLYDNLPLTALLLIISYFYKANETHQNLPLRFPLRFEWGGREAVDTVIWWGEEEAPELRSNAYTIAEQMVNKHFPGTFGSERLVQAVAAKILGLTSTPPTMEQIECERRRQRLVSQEREMESEAAVDASWRQSSKINLSGRTPTGQSVVHLDDLTMSDAERRLAARVTQHAAASQSRRSGAAGSVDRLDGRPAQLAMTDPSAQVLPVDSTPVSGQTLPKPGTIPSDSLEDVSPRAKKQSLTDVNSVAPSSLSPLTLDSPALSASVQSTQHNFEAPPIASSAPLPPLDASALELLPATTVASALMRIRVNANNGARLTISVRQGVTYAELECAIREALALDDFTIRVKHGFPPRLITADTPELPLKTGDSIHIEILSDPGASTTSKAPVTPVLATPSQADDRDWGVFDSKAFHRGSTDAASSPQLSDQSSAIDDLQSLLAVEREMRRLEEMTRLPPLLVGSGHGFSSGWSHDRWDGVFAGQGNRIDGGEEGFVEPNKFLNDPGQTTTARSSMTSRMNEFVASVERGRRALRPEALQSPASPFSEDIERPPAGDASSASQSPEQRQSSHATRLFSKDAPPPKDLFKKLGPGYGVFVSEDQT